LEERGERGMVESEKLQLPHCFSCDRCGFRSGTFRAVCPKCGREGIALKEGVQNGAVVDFVPIAYPPENLKHLGEYVSVLVKLDNGCQIFGIVLENQKSIKIGTPVAISSFNQETKELFFEIL
jgi:uncharacterized OB-fold protein